MLAPFEEHKHNMHLHNPETYSVVVVVAVAVVVIVLFCCVTVSFLFGSNGFHENSCYAKHVTLQQTKKLSLVHFS